MTKFDIEVTSDTVCPWCFVGLKKLERGIAAYKKANPSSNDTFDVTWKPFQLDPSAPVEGQDKRKVMEAKLGVERFNAAQQRLAGIGNELGIKFSFGGLTGNTRNSHRLIDLAGTKGLATQNKVVELLLAGYHENEKDITSRDYLEEAGVSAGLDKAEVAKLLDSDLRGPEVDEGFKEARRNMISGVPNFVLNHKYEIQGAQDAEGFRRVFEKIKELEG